MNKAILAICRELEQANALPKDHLYTIVEKYSTSSVFDFKVFASPLRTDVEKWLGRIDGKSMSAIGKIARVDHMHYRKLCSTTTSKYTELKESALWCPAESLDEGKAPEGYLTTAEANILVQKAIQKRFPNGVSPGAGSGGRNETCGCHNCGEAGHLRPHCPLLKNNKDGR